MAGTFVQIAQGVVTGIGILAVGIGLFYTAWANGYGVSLDFGGTVVELDIPHASAPASATPEPVTERPADVTATQSALGRPGPPTPTPIPRASADDYYDQVAADLSLLIVSLKRLQILLQEPQPGQLAWRDEMARLTSLIDDASQRLAWVHPPRDAVELHQGLLEATARCAGVTDSLGGELTQIPMDAFMLVGQTLRGCTGDVVAVLQQLNQTRN